MLTCLPFQYLEQRCSGSRDSNCRMTSGWVSPKYSGPAMAVLGGGGSGSPASRLHVDIHAESWTTLRRAYFSAATLCAASLPSVRQARTAHLTSIYALMHDKFALQDPVSGPSV